MQAEQRNELRRLVQFVTLAFRDEDIGEQYRDWKKERSAGAGTPCEPKNNIYHN